MQTISKTAASNHKMTADPFLVESTSLGLIGMDEGPKQQIHHSHLPSGLPAYAYHGNGVSSHHSGFPESAGHLPSQATFAHPHPPSSAFRQPGSSNTKAAGQSSTSSAFSTASSNSSSSVLRSPKKQSHRLSLNKATHLPFLNLASLKNYSAWPGSPVKPPTPLAVPPTPLSHPVPSASLLGTPTHPPTGVNNAAISHTGKVTHQPMEGKNFVGGVKLARSDKVENTSSHSTHASGHAQGGTLHPFALPASEPQQYMCYNLDAKTASPSSSFNTMSPPPTPGIASPSQKDDHSGDSSMSLCTPSKPAQAPSHAQHQQHQTQAAPQAQTKAKEQHSKPGSIPTAARFLAEGHLMPAFDQQYELLDELGSGGFGFVIRARRRFDGLIVAVKFIFRDRIPSHGWVKTRSWTKTPDGQPGPEKLVPLEAYVLRLIRHPGVVAFLDLLEDETVFYLVMEHHGTPWYSSSNPSSPSATTSAKVLSGSDKMSSASQQHGPGITSLEHSISPSSTFSGSNSGKSNGDRDSSPPHRGSGSDYLPDISFSSEFSTSPSSSMGPPTPISGLPANLAAPPPMLRRSSCDLFECIEQHSRLPEEQARLVFGQIVEVVFYLACMGICHRDIKDENIVVDKNFRVKLIDFGSAIIYDARKPPPYHNRFFGTVNFAASEILQGKSYRAPHAEVWSLGVLLSILLIGETPFSNPDNAIQGRITKPKCHIPPLAADLMCGCLETDPELRFTIDQVRDHPWLSLSPRP